MNTEFPRSLYADIARSGVKAVGPYRLACHPSIYYGLQRLSLDSCTYYTHPIEQYMGIDIIVAAELGRGVWELYSGNRLISYGKAKDV